ncbi:MAG: hypothetical protein ACETWQ_00100 [Phycisphaerae bacterium]
MGKPHAAFDEAGTGDVEWSRYCDTRRRKGELTGNTKFDLHQRASPRPYYGEKEMFQPYDSFGGKGISVFDFELFIGGRYDLLGNISRLALADK